jgi:hypothetical protein
MNSELDGATGPSFFGVLLATAMSMFFLFFSFDSLAGDYKVDYAIDARGVAESEGPVECTYGRLCRLEFKTAHITISLYVSVIPNTPPSVTVYGAGNGCCYFYGGERTTDINYRDYANGKNYIEDYNYNKRYVKLDIFEGRRRYGLEIVRNIKIGTVFLMLEGPAGLKNSGKWR